MFVSHFLTQTYTFTNCLLSPPTWWDKGKKRSRISRSFPSPILGVKVSSFCVIPRTNRAFFLFVSWKATSQKWQIKKFSRSYQFINRLRCLFFIFLSSHTKTVSQSAVAEWVEGFIRPKNDDLFCCWSFFFHSFVEQTFFLCAPNKATRNKIVSIKIIHCSLYIR